MNDRSRSIARVQFLGTQRVEIGSDVVTPEAERLFAMIVRLSVPLGRITSRQTMMDTPGWTGACGRVGKAVEGCMVGIIASQARELWVLDVGGGAGVPS